MNPVNLEQPSRRPNFWLRLVLMLAVVGMIFAGVFGYGAMRSYFIGKFLASFGNQTQTVATLTAAPTPWQARMSSVGTLTAVNGASLSAEVNGIVDQIHFESGDQVKAGDLLLTLRANNDSAVLAQLQAQARLDAITLARDTRQLAADAVSQAEVDTDRANLAVAQAQVQSQQQLMAEKQIRAPFAGQLGIRQVNPGQYIAAGTAVVTLEQLDPLFVDFYLPQQDFAQLRTGGPAQITLDAYPGQVFNAEITALDAVVDASTRNIEVRAKVANGALKLRPGMFAAIALPTGAPQNFVTLPQTAITYNPYGDTVFIVVHGTDAKGAPALVAKEVFVTLGDTRGDQVAVLSGVNPGDVVVTAGQLKLRNGSLVTINNSLEPENDPNPNPPNE